MKVTYINHMGDDLSVVNAARVSFGKKSKKMITCHVLGTEELNPKDAKLISYLARHNHKSPFNHAFATFHVKAPVFVARQLQKHEYMPWNEISRRYVDDDPTYYYPDEWRGRSSDKKQGSDGVIDLSAIKDTWQNNAILGSGTLEGHVTEISEWLIETYKLLLDKGVCPEQARMVLPQSMMTEWYWSGSLYAFAKMCSLRLKPDTQAETRYVAQEISEHMEELFPDSWAALMAYMR
jgi:thymidylate synthase (FAD)